MRTPIFLHVVGVICVCLAWLGEVLCRPFPFMSYTISYITSPPEHEGKKASWVGLAPHALLVILRSDGMHLARRGAVFWGDELQLSWPRMIGETLFIATFLQRSRRRLRPIGNISWKVGF